jgi:hypothetical protein
MKSIFVLVASCAVAISALAKLPAPSDDAKAKAAEAAAKTAHAGKTDAYLLCKSQNRVAAAYRKKAPAATPPCEDPGPFVYKPAAATPAAPAAAAAAAPAPEKKKKKKSSS